MAPQIQPLVSVVTPVYNAEPYLAECIESVLAQTYDNWEYVIVNNCSTDRSLEIAQQYSQRDHRIRIHNNGEFLRQLQNFNHAMHQISPQSQYCKVVHADDWLFPECIVRMVEVAEANPTVGIVGAYRLDEAQVDLDGLPYPSTVVPGREICRRWLFGELYVFGSPTSLLIRCDLIKKREAFYDEARIHADTAVCFEVLRESDFGFVHQVLTYTRRHNESVTSLTHSYNTRFLGNFAVFVTYAPEYLSREEYEAWLQQQIDGYYEFLARSVFELRGKEFLDYHRSELAKLGYPVHTLRLIKAVLLELLDFRQTTRRIRRARTARKTPSTAQGIRMDNVLDSIYRR